MVKKKKNIDDLLCKVIASEEVSRFELPDNWSYVNFDSVIKTIRNKAKSIKQKEYQEDGKYPVVDQGMPLISGYTNTEETLYTGELPVIVFGDHTRCIKWIDFQFAQGADGTKILRPIDGFYPKYFYFLLLSINLPNKGYSRHFKYLRETGLPIPPIEEQKRIVEKVERLLSKIEDAKQLIEEAMETFELRRAAILERAFQGELTRKWRNDNKINKEDWKLINLEEIAFVVDPQPSHRTPARSEDGVPYIAIKECNYDTGEIDFSNARPVSKTVLNEHINRYSINNGDFIIGKIGTVGKPFLIPTERKYTLSANVILIQPIKEKIIPKYLFYLFQSSKIENQIKSGVNATTQSAFGIKKARKLQVEVCSTEEQQKIVEILDCIFEKEIKAKKLSKLINEIEKIKKSILSKAFRGELGTNDLTEENVTELLKEVLPKQYK